MSKKIIIGSRGSDLALWQANFVKSKLENAGHPCEIKIIKTQGDKIQDLPFDKMEGKGFFTKEIEEALLRNEIDLAVHSHKDLETTNPPGLTIAAVSERANPHDLLLIRKEAYNPTANLNLKPGAIVGTSAARRIAQLHRYIAPDQIKMLRGNVPTRINKLRNGEYDAILIAAAGVERLNLDVSDLVAVELKPEIFVPAPAQGFLGIQCREEDPVVRVVQEVLDNEQSRAIINLERGVLKALSGGCQVPLGAHVLIKDDGVADFWLAYAPSTSGTADHTLLHGKDFARLHEEALLWIKQPEKKK
ncbi:hydroxymethylbilane synthase [Luteibaculum oceani]|uniref:Hydroxymethylbilane synthase n=1 Tax=Luteibaculum oceani TaxID=1294296 RepID=A0A5C6VJS9_9FLAO|nr:hydroxymethylbilane synthase [Luteibaculum oceani]TXC85129.1 hydroxymethylbilane synthase [Luteibaculum oceani]